jgi:hypothetical protein
VQRKVLYLVLVGAMAALWSMTRSHLSSVPPDVIEYRGERFKLTKAYTDFDDYKDDPDNIDPSENARVRRAVIQAKVSPEYASRTQLVRAVFDLQFPGYGMTAFGAKPQPHGTVLAAFSVEIPRADEERVLVYRGRGEVYTLIDDFVASGDGKIMQVRQEGGQLVYSDLDGKQVLVRPLAAK